MRYYVLLLLISAAAYGAASTALGVVAALAWPRLRRRAAETACTSRARIVAAARLLPAAIALAVVVILSTTFIRYEPRDTTEGVGILLAGGAALTLALLLSSAQRGLRALRAGAECARLLRRCGRRIVRDDGTRVWVIDTDYPVAAVTGIFRTRLLLSTRVIAECTASELDAVVRHERAHVRRRDNLVRAAMQYVPDALAFMQTGREMHEVWAAAAEESSDDAAAGPAAEDRTVLAAALVRVAKMASTPAPRWMPALAFYEGTNLENRVRRLLQAGARPSRMSLAAAAALFAGAGLVALALTDTVARALHGWMEIGVDLLP